MATTSPLNGNIIALTVIQSVDSQRLQRAVNAYSSGDYTITVTNHDEQGVWGYLKNGSSTEYGVVLTEKELFCSCPDRMYRHLVCKHMVVLALHTLRTLPQEKVAEEKREEAQQAAELLYGPIA